MKKHPKPVPITVKHHADPQAMPFGAKHAEDLMLPFCACGRLWSECDGSRAACKGRNRPHKVGSKDERETSVA